MSDQQTNHPGYRENSRGSLVPLSKIKPVDLARDELVTQLCLAAKEERDRLVAFKQTSNRTVDTFVEMSHSEYGVNHGGDKGNITLQSYDGRYRVLRQISDHLKFDERLQAAKALIDQCLHDFSKGSSAEIKTLVMDAFQVDKAGKVSTGRVLGLRRHKIDDPRWLDAMEAIADSISVEGSKAYLRFYERGADGKYLPISLDLAAL